MEQTLEPCGPVLLVGSFVTGLMVWRDLDVCVDAGGLRRERAWELVSPLVLHAADVIDSLWRPVAEEQLERRRRGAPLEHRLVRLPHLSPRSNRLRGPVNGLLVDDG